MNWRRIPFLHLSLVITFCSCNKCSFKYFTFIFSFSHLGFLWLNCLLCLLNSFLTQVSNWKCLFAPFLHFYPFLYFLYFHFFLLVLIFWIVTIVWRSILFIRGTFLFLSVKEIFLCIIFTLLALPLSPLISLFGISCSPFYFKLSFFFRTEYNFRQGFY